MTDDGEDRTICDEFFGHRNRLGGTALIIQCHQFELVSRNNGPVGAGMLDRKLGAMEHVLTLRRLVTCQGRHESDLDDRFRLAAAA